MTDYLKRGEEAVNFHEILIHSYKTDSQKFK